tara:strand:+ start:291 stop:452 length:162 start_codon:yes stop_codon:yes gene_type:complete
MIVLANLPTDGQRARSQGCRPDAVGKLQQFVILSYEWNSAALKWFHPQHAIEE